VCNILSVVVENVWVKARVHSETVIMNESLVGSWWWAVELVDGCLNRSSGGPGSTSRCETHVLHGR
jgi:hypothetical protein